MRLKKTLLSFLLLFALVLTGCSNHAHVQEVVDFDKEPDLSQYYVSQEEAKEEAEIKENPDLTYIDTDYLQRLKAGIGEASSERKSYNEAPQDWEFVLVDTRRADYFDRGHINGAINLPEKDLKNAKEILPKSKKTQLIFYADSVVPESSTKAAEKAKELGYENVSVYSDGLDGWKKADNYLAITTNYAKQQIMEFEVANSFNSAVVGLDTREYSDYFTEHIPNALHLNTDLFQVKTSAVIPQDKSTEIITYCDGFACESNFEIAKLLVDDGYKNVKVYSGGMLDWAKASNPTFGTKASASAFDVSDGVAERALHPRDWQKLLDSGEGVVLDVRRPDEVENGAIEDSIHIPHSLILADVEKQLINLPENKDELILIHCAAGVRAGMAIDPIVSLGYKNAYFLDHRITVDADGVHDFGVIRDLNPEEFAAKLQEKDVTVLDVRRPDEVEEGHIKGSVNIPHTELLEDPEEAAKLLPKDKDALIAIHCKAGVRAGSVIDTVVDDLGYENAYFLDHAITIDKNGQVKYE